MKKVDLNKYGFFTIKKKPTRKALNIYYSKKYYQGSEGTYSKSYSESECRYFNNKIKQKHSIILNANILSTNKKLSLLDIGCGEGFTLKHFKKLGWQVLGLDYSDYGCKTINPDCRKDLIVGDIFENIASLRERNKKFDVIWLDNVLEHVLSPFELLKECNFLTKKNGMLIVEVPNDFSTVQKYLLDKKYIDKEFWVVIPDHISYFNKEGLTNICKEAGWDKYKIISDYPVDLNLFNDNTNYVKDKSKGKSVHMERIEIENLLHSISIDKTNRLYEIMADIGIGRQIIGFFTT